MAIDGITEVLHQQRIHRGSIKSSGDAEDHGSKDDTDSERLTVQRN